MEIVNKQSMFQVYIGFECNGVKFTKFTSTTSFVQ